MAITSAERVKGLRALADFLEANPEIEAPYAELRFKLFCANKNQIAEAARRYAPLTKTNYGSWYLLVRDFGGGVVLDWTIEREKVCRRVQTGTQIVSKPKVPDGVEMEYEQVEEPVYEWECEPLLKS